jgi:hypothetical protein
MGQASGAGVGAAGMNMASNIGTALTNTGQAQAQAQLAKGQAWGNVAGSVGYLGGMGMQGYGPFASSATPPPSVPQSYVTVPGAPGAVLPGP